MEKNQRNPRRRLNSLILLVAFTAVMLIVSTYAWFTAQKNVTIGNLKGTVNVAEGLEISLDAKNWSQEIDFSDTTKYPTQNDLKKLYGETDHNIIPSEMIPVSTTGKDGLSTIGADGSVTTAGTATEMTLYNGKSEIDADTDFTKLSGIVAANSTSVEATDLSYAGYYAIDLFLRNSSRIANPPYQTNDDGSIKYDTDGKTPLLATESDAAKLARLYDKLQLNAGSSLGLLTPTLASTGLQNTVRVGFALYNSTTGTDASVSVTATQDEIIKATTTDGSTGKAKLRDVAIWEPNAADHIQLIVDSQENNKAYRIMFSDTDKGLYSTSTKTLADGSTVVDTFTTTTILPTYAIGSATATVGSVSNVYDWKTLTDTKLANKLEKQITLQTTNADDDTTFAMAGTAKYLVSVNSTGEAIYKKGDEAGVSYFYIPKNQICRIRMYVWLEGQDIDCVNQASHGGGIELDVGLVKDAEVLS